MKSKYILSIIFITASHTMFCASEEIAQNKPPVCHIIPSNSRQELMLIHERNNTKPSICLSAENINDMQEKHDFTLAEQTELWNIIRENFPDQNLPEKVDPPLLFATCKELERDRSKELLSTVPSTMLKTDAVGDVYVNYDLFLHIPPPEKIKIENSGVDKIDPETFKKFSHVTDLFLENNKLADPSFIEAFQHLPNLKTIDLSFNQMRTIPSSIFEHLPEIETAWLLFNNIETIEPDAFDGNKQLKTIGLTGNNIRTIDPEPFKKLPSLEHLGVVDNPIPIDQINALLEGLPYVTIQYSDGNLVKTREGTK